MDLPFKRYSRSCLSDYMNNVILTCVYMIDNVNSMLFKCYDTINIIYLKVNSRLLTDFSAEIKRNVVVNESQHYHILVSQQ